MIQEEMHTEIESISRDLNALKTKYFKLETLINNIVNTFSKDAIKVSDDSVRTAACGHIIDLNLSLDTISDFVSEWFGVNIHERNRSHSYMWPRFFFFYLSKRYTRLTLDKIGRKLKMHHATVIHGSRRHKEMTDYNDVEYLRCINGAEAGFISHILKSEK